MRGRIALLVLAGALLAGCASTGVTGAASGKGSGSTSPAGARTSGSGNDSPSGSASASGTGSPVGEDATVVVGAGKVTITVYEDYRCPVCKMFHDQVQPTISAALAAGTVKIEYHAVNLIDYNAGGKGSLLAANAASCAAKAAKAAKFQLYRDALFAAQPPESDDRFARPDKLISIAQSVPGLDSAAFEGCVREQPFAGSIQSTYDATFGAGKFVGTPTIFLNGAQWAVPISGDMVGSFKQALIRAGG